MKKSRLLGAVCAFVFSVISMPSHAAVIPDWGTWVTTLQGRDLDGNAATFEAYYDTVLDITWHADPSPFGTDRAEWDTANTWATTLNVNGVTGWRLPNIDPIDGVALQFDRSYDGTRWLSENTPITAHYFHHVSFLYGQIQFYSLVEIT